MGVQISLSIPLELERQLAFLEMATAFELSLPLCMVKSALQQSLLGKAMSLSSRKVLDVVQSRNVNGM